MAEQDFTQDVVGNGEFGEADNTAVKTEIKTEDSSATSEATATNESNGNGIPKGADDNSAEDRKLFVGGLSWETREPQLKSYFEAFGEVESVNLKLNPMTGRYENWKVRLFAKLCFSTRHKQKFAVLEMVLLWQTQVKLGTFVENDIEFNSS